MPDDNLSGSPEPVTDSAPLSLDSAASSLANLVSDSQNENPAPDTEDNAEPELTADEAAIKAAEDVDGDTPPADADSPPDSEQGRFVADNAKVRLSDGTTITVAELKRNNLFQRDYTKKTTEHSEAIKAFEARKSEVDQLAQSQGQTLEWINWFTQNFTPQAPQPPTDPGDQLAYLNYLRQKEVYDQFENAKGYFSQQKQVTDQHKQREQAEQLQTRLRDEMGKLAEADAMFKDRAKAKSFFDKAAEEAGSHYGFSPEEVYGIADHRFVLALKDALAFRRLKANAATAASKVKQPVQPQGSRQAPRGQVHQQRQAQSERFRKSNSVEDAGALIATLIR